MTAVLDKNYLLFDGDCGVCGYLSRIASGMDRKSRFDIRPYQSVPEAELKRFGVTYQKCNKRLYAISRAGRVFPGAFGANYFLMDKFPWSVLVVVIYLLPVLLLLEVIGYRIFALNRRRISGWLGLEACSISSHKPQPGSLSASSAESPTDASDSNVIEGTT
jgi:predicted DCC family thiol-disulfide oxidoreductase YuxK